MQFKQIIFQLTRSYSLDSFNYIKPTARVVIDLDEGETPTAAFKIARIECETVISDAISRAKQGELPF